jgi:transcriptional regulator with XRE-family HTH domain
MMTFTNRLRSLIAERSVSEFSRTVGLSESLIRKYLKGSEPSLSRALQIATACQCSLVWLASGEGLPFDPIREVDIEAMEAALRIVAAEPDQIGLKIPDTETLKRIIGLYQYLRDHHLRDGTVDEHLGQVFSDMLRENGVPTE